MSIWNRQAAWFAESERRRRDKYNGCFYVLWERIARDAGLGPYLAHAVAIETQDALVESGAVISGEGSERGLEILDGLVAKYR